MFSVGEYDSNTCEDIAMEIELMQLHVESDLHEGLELENELRHALGCCY